jgi:geranylgeranyl reductase family protein
MFLAKAGIDCILVDKARFPRDKICGDALSGKVVQLLKKLDPSILSDLAAEPSQIGSSGVVFVAPNLKVLRVPFRSATLQLDYPAGFLCRRMDFDNFLVRQTRKYPGIKLMEGTQISEYSFDKGRWHISSKSRETTISAKILIIADGAHSQFARHQAGILQQDKHYVAGLRAYYRNVSGLDSENFIELHFLKEFLPGYFWIFPLSGGMANVGVGMRSDKVSAKKMHLKNTMLEMIRTVPSLKARFSDAELVGGISGYGLPLGSKKRKISGEGYMLIGDAGALIDPFTGEGIGNAMASAMAAAETAESCLRKNDCSALALGAYNRLFYGRLWAELRLSYKMQRLGGSFPGLINLVVNKAAANRTLSETISCMFEDLDMRDRLKKPSFYFKLLFGNS